MSKAKGKVKLKWSPKFAYAIGLIVSDGNLSPDGRHHNFTSKDADLIQHYLDALEIPDTHIGKKSRYNEEDKKYFVVQFGDVLFYRFLVSIGLMPNKSRSLSAIDVPTKYFSHFVRGVFDGDGSFNSYWDPRWKSSFMFYISFASASPLFLQWLQKSLLELYGIKGYISSSKGSNCQLLKYAKSASRILQEKMYEDTNGFYLKRKYLKIIQALSILSRPT